MGTEIKKHMNASYLERRTTWDCWCSNWTTPLKPHICDHFKFINSTLGKVLMYWITSRPKRKRPYLCGWVQDCHKGRDLSSVHLKWFTGAGNRLVEGWACSWLSLGLGRQVTVVQILETCSRHSPCGKVNGSRKHGDGPGQRRLHNSDAYWSWGARGCGDGWQGRVFVCELRESLYLVLHLYFLLKS